MLDRLVLWGASAWIVSALTIAPTLATPQFARKYDLTCNACHAVVPRLNEGGLGFQASGFAPPPARSSSGKGAGRSILSTLPIAAWTTVRYEDRGTGAASDFYLPKVELISGGRPMKRLSYFVEWRIVSLALQDDGALADRGGRFEDLFVNWDLSKGHAVKAGQYRSLNQVDVSQRLSIDEPTVFNNSLPTGTDPDPRIAGLMRFSPSSRSPSLGWSWRSIGGESAGDGLFHYMTIPFTGEFSIPLGPEAADRASFELEGPKGVYGETFWRRGLRSIGANAFYDQEAWLATIVGTFDWSDLLLTAALGVDDTADAPSRGRASFEAEYLFLRRECFRAALGLRVEDVTDDDRRERYVPYLVLAGPNTRYTTALQGQYVSQQGRDTILVDLSFIF